jgi:hypothetical protein
MRGIDKEVEFSRNDGAWHAQCDASLASHPCAAESLSRYRIGISPPGLGVTERTFDRSAGKSNGRSLPFEGTQVLDILNMNQRFHGSQCPRFRAIDDSRSREIPAPTVPKCTVARKSRPCEAPGTESPNRDGLRHENIPSSNLWSTASTSRAPGSVLAKSSGVRPPSTRRGRFSQRRARSFVPSARFALS